MKSFATFLALLVLPLAARADGVGLTELSLRDESRQRPVELKVWYPTATAGELMTYDLAFMGRAQWEAPYHAGPGRRPLVLLSHGDRGSNVDQSWLAEALAQRGYIVAAVSHWLNTWKNNTPEATLKVWERPKDISFAIDRLLAHPTWGRRINGERIAVAGHSVGGYTALALAGADYSPRQMLEYCESSPEARECSFGEGANRASIDFSQSKQPTHDPRIKAVIAMAPALAPGIRTTSLEAITVPVLLVSAKDDEILAHERNAAVYSHLVPNAELLDLPAGGHFVFLPECTLVGMGVTFLHPFDICGLKTQYGVSRASVHAQVVKAAVTFLDAQLKTGLQQTSR